MKAAPAREPAAKRASRVGVTGTASSAGGPRARADAPALGLTPCDLGKTAGLGRLLMDAFRSLPHLLG